MAIALAVARRAAAAVTVMAAAHMRRRAVHGVSVTPAAAAAAAAADVELDPSRYEFVAPQFTMARGIGVVHDPLTNKGTGFPLAERDRLGIRGLVPPRTLTLEQQAEKIMHLLRLRQDDLDKHVWLNDLMDRNETLFFHVLAANIAELAPLIYTPTVGLVCQRFGSYFRRARGMYLSSLDRGEMTAAVYNWPRDDVEVVVVTDGSRILGLGDLGANGMGIPIGKLALYVAAGGIDPRRVLPVMLDAGTDNLQLRNDPWYLGVAHPRLTGDAYFAMVHEFVSAIHTRWPNAVIQFEDFSSDKAQHILEAYRTDHLCFNDDIQGTGAVTLASILAAIRAQGPGARLRDQRVVVCGAGSAGIGVSQSLYDAMLQEGAEPDDARARIWLLDKDGLLGPERPAAGLSPAQRFFRREHAGGLLSHGVGGPIGSISARFAPGSGLRDRAPLLNVVTSVKPTILLGLTGVGGGFTEPVVRAMAAGVHRPIIFPLSNPTSHAECTAEQAYSWSEGRAIVASGSPFAPVVVNGRRLTPSQTNNMYIFPGIGLGAITVGAKRITDRMFYAAARALSEMVTQAQIDEGLVLPPITDIRKVSARVAAAVAASGIADGIVSHIPTTSELVSFMQARMYEPRYQPLVCNAAVAATTRAGAALK